MAIDFDKYLTNEQKAALITQRIQEFVVQAYQFTLNRGTIEELQQENAEEMIAKIDEDLVNLEKAIAYQQKELALIPLPVVE
jgi:hypothetical protein